MDRWIDRMSDEDLSFIKRFVLASGSLKAMADAYGISYPTVRLRLDRLIERIKIYDSEKITSDFERVLRAQYADGKIDLATLKTLLEAHKKELEAQMKCFRQMDDCVLVLLALSLATSSGEAFGAAATTSTATTTGARRRRGAQSRDLTWQKLADDAKSPSRRCPGERRPVAVIKVIAAADRRHRARARTRRSRHHAVVVGASRGK